MADRVSALATMAASLAAASSDAVAVCEVPFLTQVDVRVDGGAANMLGLPQEPGTVATGHGRTALWLGPDEWLIVAADGRADAVVDDLLGRAAGAWVSLVDLSANRTALELTGPRAREVLAKGCSLDLHPAVFTPGRCAQTTLARAQVILEARAGDAVRVFVRCSFARYLAAWLIDAMAEYGATGGLMPPPAAAAAPRGASAPSARAR